MSKCRVLENMIWVGELLSEIFDLIGELLSESLKEAQVVAKKLLNQLREKAGKDE